MKYALVLLFACFQINAAGFGEPKVKSVSVENTTEEEVLIDMGTTHVDGIFYEYALVRIDKKRGVIATAQVLHDTLAHCNILAVNQHPEGVVADVLIAFDVENDGGYNSCTVHFANGERSVFLELGAEVGE